MRGGLGVALVATVPLLLCLSALCVPVLSAAAEDDITWTTDAETIEIETANATILLSKMFPAVMVRHVDDEGVHGDGFTFSSILGYNATDDGGIILDEVPYRAPFNQSVWSLEGPVRGTSPDGTAAVIVTLSATVDMHRRLVIGGGGNPEPSTPGSEVIPAWADIVVKYTVSATDTYSAFDWLEESPQYPINGSSEIKFDISIAPKEDIFADRLALDIGLMKMDYGVFEPSLTAGPYYFRGYEYGEVCVCDPTVNETDGTELIVHTFQARDDLKQLFSFVETDENETGFFGWASQAMQSLSEAESNLENVTAFYRTDGTSLRVYMATPLNESTAMVVHDPSIGLLGDGTVDYPDTEVGGFIGLSPLSVAAGVVAGLATSGIFGVYWVRKSRAGDRDPADEVSLESNRYYRHGP
jgi:hypothetical protein